MALTMENEMKPDAKSCEEALEWIDGQAAVGQDGSQTDESGPEGPLAAHLEDCAACREQYARARALRSALATWEAPAPRVNIQARVMASIVRHEREQAGRQGVRSLRELIASVIGWRVQMPGYALAALVVVLVASLAWNVVGRRGRAGAEPGVSVAGAGPGARASMAGLPAMSVAGIPVVNGVPAVAIATPGTVIRNASQELSVQRAVGTPVGAQLVAAQAGSGRAGAPLLPVMFVVLGAPSVPTETLSDHHSLSDQTF